MSYPARDRCDLCGTGLDVQRDSKTGGCLCGRCFLGGEGEKSNPRRAECTEDHRDMLEMRSRVSRPALELIKAELEHERERSGKAGEAHGNFGEDYDVAISDLCFARDEYRKLLEAASAMALLLAEVRLGLPCSGAKRFGIRCECLPCRADNARAKYYEVVS